MKTGVSRRDVLKYGGVIAVGLVTPSWLSTIAKADMLRMSQGEDPTAGTVLVVIELSGGNDGLNTVVPYTDQEYYKFRPTLALPEPEVLKLSDSLGLHPKMTGLKELFDQGKVAVVNNVGYPKPNRSHFKSMEIWQSASPEKDVRDGWIGRHFDHLLNTGPLNPVVALGLSTEKPQALAGASASIPCFASLADVQSMVGDPDMERMLREIQGQEAASGTTERAVQQANNTALDAMAVLRDRLKGYEPKGEYKDDRFGQGFKQIAHLIATAPMTRVIYFSAGGFDTHANQKDQHANLLEQFSNGLNTFQKEIEALGQGGRVVTLVFSEFGRRVDENASQGTDHGAAAPMFLVGQPVKGGLYGGLPNLKDLGDGDLKFSIDFRSVYATTLDQWMGGDSGVVLGEKFDHLGLLA